MTKVRPTSVLLGLFICVATAEPPKATGKDSPAILLLRDPEREHAFAAHLLAMAEREDELQASLKRLSGSVGLLPAQLGPKDRELLKKAEEAQAEIEAEFVEFQKNLTDSLKAQGNDRLNELLKAVGKPEAREGTQQIRKKIQGNHSYVAMIEMAEWSKALRGWAGKLNGPREPQSKSEKQ
ncbi:hypothetical protein [Haloferula sp.]|uniref:hypothetical protein n=1 Tax=Haloferula sp. TaxID=2497595 RepID=UPI003C78C2B1